MQSIIFFVAGMISWFVVYFLYSLIGKKSASKKTAKGTVYNIANTDAVSYIYYPKKWYRVSVKNCTNESLFNVKISCDNTNEMQYQISSEIAEFTLEEIFCSIRASKEITGIRVWAFPEEKRPDGKLIEVPNFSTQYAVSHEFGYSFIVNDKPIGAPVPITNQSLAFFKRIKSDDFKSITVPFIYPHHKIIIQIETIP